MKGYIIAFMIMLAMGAGGWYYTTQVHSTAIGKIVSNPRDYYGKEITISGTVTERFSFFVLKSFNLRDPSGNIPIVTDRLLPAVGAKIRVKGQVQEGFSLGDQQLVVFIESSK